MGLEEKVSNESSRNDTPRRLLLDNIPLLEVSYRRHCGVKAPRSITIPRSEESWERGREDIVTDFVMIGCPTGSLSLSDL
jgi:hypothetical protein